MLGANESRGSRLDRQTTRAEEIEIDVEGLLEIDVELLVETIDRETPSAVVFLRLDLLDPTVLANDERIQIEPFRLCEFSVVLSVELKCRARPF